MNVIKKLAGFLLVFTIAFCACGCYRVDPAPMSALIGTYELTEYSRTYPSDQEGQPNKTDFKTEKQISAYLVIDGTNFGYVVYRDSETALLCNRVYVTYTYSQDEPENVELIEYRTANKEDTPIIERGKLGFLAKEKKLNQQLPRLAIENGSLVTKYTDYTEFTRADDATDLSFVTGKLGSLPAPVDFALTPYDGAFVLSDSAQAQYIYYVMEIDAAEKSATVDYALKSDGERVTLTNVPVDYELGDNGISAATVIVGDKRFAAFLDVEELQEIIPSGDGYEIFLHYIPFDGDVERYIEQAMQDYAENP